MHDDAGRGSRALTASAWAAFALCVALWAVALVFGWLSRSLESSTSWSGGGFLPIALFVIALFAFPVTGLLIATRRPGNRIGWLLLAIGLGWGVANSTSYADYALRLHHPSLPGAVTVAAVGSSAWIVPIGLTGTFLILLFPDGRLPGRRWRAVAWLSAAGIVVGVLSLVLTPGSLAGAGYPHSRNPYGIQPLAREIDAAKLALLVVPVMMVASAAALIVRFRRARGDARQQVKWLAAAAALVASIYAVVEPLSALLDPGETHAPAWMVLAQDVALMSFALIPTAIGIAVLRHRLFDIDLIVRRTLVYAALVACLAAIYLAGVFVIEGAVRSVTGGSGTVAVTLSTLAVAAAFQPLRRRIQRVVDRRFYRGAYDAARTLEAFSARMRGEIDLEALSGDVLAVVGDALHPAHAALWLAPTEADR